MQNIYNNLSPHDKLIFGTVKWEINPPTIPYVLPETVVSNNMVPVVEED